MLEYLKNTCYKNADLSDDEIQKRIDAANRMEQQRKEFVSNIISNPKKKKK